MSVSLQIRRDTQANWTSKNPILADGEWALEKDTKKLKMGDGVTPWNSLDYIQVKGDQGDIGVPGDGVNIGDIVMSVRSPGANYLECNGAVYERASYATLASQLDPTSSVYDNNRTLTAMNVVASNIPGSIAADSPISIDADATGTYVVLNDNVGLTNKVEVFKRVGEEYVHLSGAITNLNSAYSIYKAAAISPDGNYIAAMYTRTGSTGNLHIFKRTGDSFSYLKTISTASISSTAASARGRQIAFSPDGKYLAVRYAATSSAALYYVEGENYTAVTGLSTTAATTSGGLNFSANSKYLFDQTRVYELNGTSVITLTETLSTVTDIQVYAGAIGKRVFGINGAGRPTAMYDSNKVEYAQITYEYQDLMNINTIVCGSSAMSVDNKMLAYVRSAYTEGSQNLFVFGWNGEDYLPATIPGEPGNIRRITFAGTNGEYLLASKASFPFFAAYKRGPEYDPTTHFTVPVVKPSVSGAYTVKAYIRAS